MQQFRDTVDTPTGRPIPGATVTVTISGGGTPTLYSDNGTTALGSNVLTTDGNGEYKFYAANGRYTFTIAATGYTGTTRDVVLFDPADQLTYLDAGANGSTRINAAIAALGGHGVVKLGPGTFTLTNSNPGAVNWNSKRAIWINADGVTLEGAGEGVTFLELANSADCHAIQIGNRGDAPALAVSNVTVRGLTINGNRANQTAPTSTDDHWGGIDVASDCTRVKLRHMHIHDCQYYGIGFERNGFVDCLVEDVLIEDTGADGIDCKDDDGTSTGNAMNRVTVRRFGLASTPLDLQAGVNPRSGWRMTGITVEDFSGDSHGIRIDNTSSGTVNANQCSLEGFYVNSGAVDTTMGVHINSSPALVPNIVVSKGTIVGTSIGIDARGRAPRIDSVRVSTCTTGFQLKDESQLSLCRADACTTGYKLRGNLNLLTNCAAHDNTTGLVVDSGATLNRIDGGTFDGNTTNVTDDGTQTAIERVVGIDTNAVGTASVLVDATGELTITIPHNLDFTPDLKDVTLTLQRDTLGNTYVIGYMNVYLADATNVYCKVFVSSASASAGMTVTLMAHCVAKKANRQ